MEVISDRQKNTFRADPENAGKFITTGSELLAAIQIMLK